MCFDSHTVLANLKLSTPALEELLKAAGKYHTLLEQVNVAASAFVDCLGKVFVRYRFLWVLVGVTACRARGATSELGLQFQKLVARHRGVGGLVFIISRLLDYHRAYYAGRKVCGPGANCLFLFVIDHKQKQKISFVTVFSSFLM